MVGVEEGVRKGWCSNLLLSDFDSAKRGIWDSRPVSLQAPLCVWTLGRGIKDAQVHMRGGGGPQLAPAFHTRILARAQYNVSPSGQIFAGASIYSHLVAV